MNKDEMREALLQAGWTIELIEPFLADETPWQPVPTVTEIAAELLTIDSPDVVIDPEPLVSSGEFLAFRDSA